MLVYNGLFCGTNMNKPYLMLYLLYLQLGEIVQVRLLPACRSTSEGRFWAQINILKKL